MKKISRYILNKLLLSLLTAASLLLLTLFTNPNSVALPVLIAPFIIIGFLMYQITQIVLTKKHSFSSQLARQLFALSVAGLFVALMLLRSLHQLTIKDGLLVCGFAIVFWLYMWRADFLHK